MSRLTKEFMKMRKTLALLLCLAAVPAIPVAAIAHGFTKPQHGGVVKMSGETLFELVTSSAGVSIYVIDEDEPVDAAAMTAKMSVLSKGKKTEIAMAPAGGNRFFAKGLKIPKGANVGVLVIDKTTKARLGATFIVE